MFKTQDLHVRELVKLSSLRAVKAQWPMTDAVSAVVAHGRDAAGNFCSGGVAAEVTKLRLNRRLADVRN